MKRYTISSYIGNKKRSELEMNKTDNEAYNVETFLAVSYIILEGLNLTLISSTFTKSFRSQLDMEEMNNLLAQCNFE